MVSDDGKWYAIMHPKIANGYWDVQRVIPLFRWLGRKLKSRRIYWLGFQVRWWPGLLEQIENMKWYGSYANLENIGVTMTKTVDDMVKDKCSTP